MSLEERLDSELHDAIRANDVVRKTTIRAVKTAITEAKVAGTEVRQLSDEDVLAIVVKQIKQRRDSIEEFTRGNRPDLVAGEELELVVLQGFLPEQMPEAAVRDHIGRVVAELGVSGQKGMGPVMKRVSNELRGKADGPLINRVVRELLGIK
jgi:uncharacterized protein